MSRYAPVQIHQNTKEPSISSDFSRSSSSYASSSGSSTPRSFSPGDYREHDASGFVSRVIRSGDNIVVNHGKVGFDEQAPQISTYTTPRRSS